MKLHLPVRLFKSVLACLTAVASFSLGSGVAWADAQNLTFSGSRLIWDTSTENKLFVDEEDAAASFAAGDNVSFTGKSTVTLGENITAGTLDIAAGADVTIDLEEYTLHTDTISLSGTLAVGNSLSIASGSTLAVKNAAAVLDSALVLGEKSGLVVESAASLNSHTLTLQGGSNLILTAAGDGKTYTLFSGISSLVDKTGNTLTAGSYSVNDYFDTTQPGTGFWKDATLVLNDGTFQLVRHNKTVKDAVTIPTRRTDGANYQYYESVAFEYISTTSHGGAIYGYSSTITLNNNGSVIFSGNSAKASNYDAYGGAIYGGYDSTITLSNNGSVTFSGNSAKASYYDAYGGAIYGGYDSTITLSDNGSVTFSSNRASSSNDGTYAYGGAIYGGYDSTITLSDNVSVTFIGNTASSSDYSASGGAIYGSVTMTGNGSVTFSGNTASGYSSDGGAIYGWENSTITLSNNGSVKFNGNTASYGGAIYTYHGSLHIRNNDSVEFAGNVEKRGSSYRLRSVSVYGGSDGVLNISSAAGKKVAFYDSIYVGSDVTVNFNADYADAAGHIIKQQGDIIFSGATTEDDLYKAKGNVAGTAEEILNSRTTEVYSMTNLYGGRLRVEEGAIYQGQGITAHEGSGATVRVKDATLSHSGYDLTFNAGTTLELAGMNSITGNVQMLEGSILSFDGTETQGVTCLTGNLGFTGAPIVSLGDTPAWTGENHALLYVNGTISGWDADTLTVLGSAYGSDNLYCLNNDLLVLNYNAETFNPHFRGDIVITSCQQGPAVYKYFADVSFENIMGASFGGAIYGDANSTITLSNNGSVTFSGNTPSSSSYACGGAIAGSVTMTGNGDVTFSGNTASSTGYDAYGGAIYGSSGSNISLNNNGSVTFSGNKASGRYAYCGAIYTYGDLSIRNNDSVLFEKNVEKSGSSYRLCSIYSYGDVSLSAAEGKGIEFRDALNINFDSTVELNADYTDAEGVIHKQTGDIIFTGAYTEQHLNELLAADGLNRTATEAEILNSRTTEVQAMTNLYGGRLRVEDGAIYKGYGITAMENSAATVLVKDATLDHAGYNLVFHSGTTLELVGDNVVSANRLQMHTDSSLIFRENAGLVLDGTLNVQGEGTLLLENGSLSAHKIDGTGGISITGGSLELQDDTDALAVDGAVRISNTTLSGNWCGEGLTVDGVSVAADAEISLKNLTLKSVLSNEGALVLGGEVSIASEVFGFVGGDVQYSAGASGYRYVVHDYTLVEGCGQITAAADVIWKIKENGADQDYQSYSYTNGVLTAKKILDATTYWVNDAVTYDGRSEFDSATTLVLNGGNLTMSKGLGTNLTGGIRVDAASTLSLSSGVEVQRAQLSGVSASNTVSLDGAGKLNLGSSADFTGYALSKGWSGTVKLENITTDTNLDMNTIGQSGSTIELENVMGYTGVNGGTVAADLQLNRSTAADGTEQAALVISNGYSHKTNADHVMTTFSGTVSGAGKMVYEKTLSNEYTGFAFSGDVSGWTGAFEMNGGKTFNLVFNGKSTEIKADIRDISGNGTLNLRLGADAAMQVKGTVDTDSITVTNDKAVSFGGVVSTGSLLASESQVGFASSATISGNMEVAELVLAAGATVDVGGCLTTGSIVLEGLKQDAAALTVGSFDSGNVLFALNGDALSGLNLGHGESVTIATSGAAFADGFKALMANGTEKMTVTVYDYIISQNANNVVVTADYANWGTRVWYEGAWVGDESWSDMLIGGYSVTDGVERVDLQGDVLETENLFIVPGSSCSSVVITNGEIYADYAELADASLTIGTGATLSVYEFLAEEKEVLLQGTLDVSNASIGTLTGTSGSLSIQPDGVMTVDSNVTLGSFSSDGVLDIGSHTLNVAGGVSRAGSVIAGEVRVHNSGRNAVQFDTLIADKVTVTNRLSSSSYSDDISVGGGSAIGELVAETLELRDGSMQLGRDDKATSQSLQKLKLAAGSGMELNENTALTVTGTLDAGVNTTVSMKQGASLSYGDVRISNKRSDATASVTARELADGTGAVVTNAHATFTAAAEKSVDFLFASSSVENAGSALLTLTNSGSTLTGLHATGGNVDVLALGAVSLVELEISTAKTISAASVTVTELAKLADGAKLAGNLTLASGASVELGGTLTLEGALNLQTGLTLSGTVLETIAGLEEGQSHILFSGVTELNVQESMTLNNMRSLAARTQDAVSYRELMDGQQVSAGDYFSNLAGNSGLVLSYNSESGTVSISYTQAIPEPATATLSLMALAALAARRRRK